MTNPLEVTEPSRLMLQLDQYLMQPGVEDSELTRAIIALRNVFARSAKLATSATVALGQGPPFQTAPRGSVLGAALAQFCAEEQGVGR